MNDVDTAAIWSISMAMKATKEGGAVPLFHGQSWTAGEDLNKYDFVALDVDGRAYNMAFTLRHGKMTHGWARRAK
jgi:hypothetical protein